MSGTSTDSIRAAVSIAAGMLGAAGLWHLLHASAAPGWPDPSKPAARIRVTAAATPAPVEAATKPSPVLPLRGEIAALRKTVPKPSTPAKPAPLPTPVSATALPSPTPMHALPTIEQPALHQLPVVRHLELPTIASEQLPPAPQEPQQPQALSLASVVRPGGTAMVLAVLVDDTGTAIRTKILVSSQYALQDVSASMANLNRKWFDLNPALQPGEQRWLELLIDHGRLHPTGDPIP